jgi:hypothetical protein
MSGQHNPSLEDLEDDDFSDLEDSFRSATGTVTYIWIVG